MSTKKIIQKPIVKEVKTKKPTQKKVAKKVVTKRSTPIKQKLDRKIKKAVFLPAQDDPIITAPKLEEIIEQNSTEKIIYSPIIPSKTVEKSIEVQKINTVLESKKNNKINSIFAWLIILLFVVGGYAWVTKNQREVASHNNNNVIQSNKEFDINQIKQFASVEEFKSYLAKSPQGQYGQFLNAIDSREVSKKVLTTVSSDEASSGVISSPQVAETELIDRVSNTNTQVLNIDEPDIVKTDGENIYLSSNQFNIFRSEPGIMSEKMMIMPPYDNGASVKIINALPIKDAKVLSEIKQSGEMFVGNGILVVFSTSDVYGYDISDPKNPQEKWRIKLEDNTYIMDSRLYGDKIYLVLSNFINNINPCPIRPLSINSTSLEITCSDIYHPEMPLQTDSIFTALKIDISSGSVLNKTSFVGSRESSNIYMSQNALYISYFYTVDNVKFFYDFLNAKATDLFPETVSSKVEKLISYDISYEAKSIELSSIISNYYASLDGDERLRIENELTNRMSSYYELEMRQLEKTGIMKISLTDLKIIAGGAVPGKLLNQFSMDEYSDNLRIATTIGQNSWYYFGNISPKSANDVYVLDSKLDRVSSVMNLGREEKIYSVRFLGDRGYVVTFKQVDPFYVIDLTDPKNINLKGELKIPGYSSYLHPISDNIILGIGKEEQNVKISMFDVSDPTNPKEIDTYMLNEYWTEVKNNHRAFLLDRENNIFFMPASNGAYVFGYENNELKLLKAISENAIKRAVYINNYLYVLSDNVMIIYDEADWKELNRLEL